MNEDQKAADEMTVLLRACAEALEKRDTKGALRLWREIMRHMPPSGAARRQ